MGEAGPSLMSHYLPAAQNQALLKSQDYIRFILQLGSFPAVTNNVRNQALERQTYSSWDS